MQASSDDFSRFVEKAGQIRVLTKVEEQDLAARIKRGDHGAKQRLIEHNIRLVLSIAKRYQNMGVPLEDLVQEGMIGVDRAAGKFDADKGFKFSTYATWWIRHMIQRALHKNRATIRVPAHIVERKRKLNRYMREHPDADIAEAAADQEITLDQADEALDASRVVASLDAPITDDDGGGNRHSMIPDDEADDPSEIAVDPHPRLSEALTSLDDIQRRVIKLRFGFDGPPRPRDEVATLLGVRPHTAQRAQRAGLAELRRILGDDLILSESEGTA